MGQMLNTISLLFLPGMLTLIIGYGAWKKAPVYEHFIAGAKEGLSTALEILPYIIAIFIAIEGLIVSGAMTLFQQLLEPLCQVFGFPEELVPLFLMRPVSGSASLGLLSSLLQSEGADSLVGRIGAVMMGTSETVFYVLAVYFSATKVKDLGYSLWAGLAGYLVGVTASVFFVCIIE